MQQNEINIKYRGKGKKNPTIGIHTLVWIVCGRQILVEKRCVIVDWPKNADTNTSTHPHIPINIQVEAPIDRCRSKDRKKMFVPYCVIDRNASLID